jgi:hypothetical protein
MDDGIFHDAHEVYKIDRDGSKTWVATFATKGLADWYVTAATEGMLLAAGFAFEYEVVPV